MVKNPSHLNKDGISSANSLAEIFALDIATAQIECRECYTMRPVDSLHPYAASMGIVLRCPNCDSVLIRAVRTPHGCWLEMATACHLRFLSLDATLP